MITLLALRWIVALLISTDRAGDIPVPVATHEGTTILRPAALTGAVTREIGTYHGVDTARARIIGDAADPEVVIAVTASQTADLRALHQRIETQALSHVRHAVGNTSLPIRLHLDVSRRTTSPASTGPALVCDCPRPTTHPVAALRLMTTRVTASSASLDTDERPTRTSQPATEPDEDPVEQAEGRG